MEACVANGGVAGHDRDRRRGPRGSGRGRDRLGTHRRRQIRESLRRDLRARTRCSRRGLETDRVHRIPHPPPRRNGPPTCRQADRRGRWRAHGRTPQAPPPRPGAADATASAAGRPAQASLLEARRDRRARAGGRADGRSRAGEPRGWANGRRSRRGRRGRPAAAGGSPPGSRGRRAWPPRCSPDRIATATPGHGTTGGDRWRGGGRCGGGRTSRSVPHRRWRREAGQGHDDDHRASFGRGIDHDEQLDHEQHDDDDPDDAEAHVRNGFGRLVQRPRRDLTHSTSRRPAAPAGSGSSRTSTALGCSPRP